jgi:hypothetical protein
MASTQAKPHLDKFGELAEMSSTWEMLIEQGMHEAKSTLMKMNDSSGEEGHPTREAWMMVDRAFQSSVNALRALTS